MKFRLLLILFTIICNHGISMPGGAYKNEIGISGLRSTYGKHKQIPEKYELQCLIALSRYPELSNTTIYFEYNEIKTTMAARPLVSTLFGPAKERKYTIIINNKAAELKGVSIDELSFNAQIGIIAHELAHVLEYTKMSSAQIILCGGCYYSSSYYHRKMERQTDLITIQRGFGEQLYEFSNYVINQSQACESYKKFKEKFYYRPIEIKEAMSVMKEVY